MKFRDCTSMNSTGNIQEGYTNGLSKTALEFKNCKQQLYTLTMCLPACLWAQIAKTPFNYTITAQTLLAKCDDYRFQRLILQFPALGKKYGIASMFIITRAVSTPRGVKRRENGSMFCEKLKLFPSGNGDSYESSRKHENIALKSTMTTQWSSLIRKFQKLNSPVLVSHFMQQKVFCILKLCDI